MSAVAITGVTDFALTEGYLVNPAFGRSWEALPPKPMLGTSRTCAGGGVYWGIGVGKFTPTTGTYGGYPVGTFTGVYYNSTFSNSTNYCSGLSNNWAAVSAI